MSIQIPRLQLQTGRGAFGKVLHDRLAMTLAVGERQQHVEDDRAEGQQIFGGA